MPAAIRPRTAASPNRLAGVVVRDARIARPSRHRRSHQPDIHGGLEVRQVSDIGAEANVTAKPREPANLIDHVHVALETARASERCQSDERSAVSKCRDVSPRVSVDRMGEDVDAGTDRHLESGNV